MKNELNMIENNPQYKELRVKAGEYIPDAGIEYPTDPSVRMVNPPKTHPFDIDENYPYYDKSKEALKQRRIAYSICRTFVFFVNRIKWGFKCEGRENLKKYKEVLKEGCVTTCNHAYRWDMVSVIQATGHDFYIPMYGENMKTDDHWYMKSIGGIPIPTTLQAMKKYDAAMDQYHADGHWIHLFPEGIRWDFYKPLKPFHKGAFTMAYRWGCPILPCYITFRKRTGLYKLTGKANEPLITCHIGTPILPDSAAPRKVEVERITKEVWDQMLQLGGIEHNPWPIYAK